MDGTLFLAELWRLELFPVHTLVDGAASGVALFGAVIVGDGGFAHLPAEEDNVAIDAAGEIEETDLEILDLDSDGVDFGESVFGDPDGLFARGLAGSTGANIYEHSSVEKDALAQFAELLIDLLDQSLRFDGLAQQAFQNR